MGRFALVAFLCLSSISGAEAAWPRRVVNPNLRGYASTANAASVTPPRLLRFLTATQQVEECGTSTLTTDSTLGTTVANLSYTGASTHACTRSDGTVVVLASGKPRIECGGTCTIVTPASGATPAQITGGKLLVEPPATNYVTTSENVTAASKTGSVTYTANQYTAPDGNLTADQIVYVSGTGQAVYYALTGLPSGTQWVTSAYVRSHSGATSESVMVNCVSGSAPACTCARSDGGACTATSSGTTCYADGQVTTTWTRLEARAVCTTAVTSVNTLLLAGRAALNSPGSGGFWGWQFEAGTVATSYIPTSGGTATRAADKASFAGTYALTATPSFAATFTPRGLPSSVTYLLEVLNSPTTQHWDLGVTAASKPFFEWYNAGDNLTASTATLSVNTAARIVGYSTGSTNVTVLSDATSTAATVSISPPSSLTNGLYLGETGTNGTGQVTGYLSDICVDSTSAGCR